MREILSIWTIYDHSKDIPEYFVARRFQINEVGSMPTQDLIINLNLDKLRLEMKKRRLNCIKRYKNDDPRIVESWI